MSRARAVCPGLPTPTERPASGIGVGSTFANRRGGKRVRHCMPRAVDEVGLGAAWRSNQREGRFYDRALPGTRLDLQGTAEVPGPLPHAEQPQVSGAGLVLVLRVETQPGVDNAQAQFVWVEFHGNGAHLCFGVFND